MRRAIKSAAKLVVLENNDPITSETEEIQNRVRQRAYELSQERGHSGRDVDDWLTAESEIISIPPAEVIEKDGRFELRFAIAGVDPENMQVMTSSDRVLVKCDYRHEHEAEAGTIHLCDFKSATVFRSVQLPQPIDLDSVDIQFEDGLLTITAAKEGAEQARNKRPAARKAPAKKKRAS